MGRIQIPAAYVHNSSHAAWVGWDSPLETFFGQVYDVLEGHYNSPEDETDDPIIHWVGLKVGEIKTVSELDEKMGDYCNIPESIAAQLMDDYNNRTEPAPLQKWGRSL